MNTLFHWHAVYTKTGCEQKVAEILSRKGFETYCPLHTILKENFSRKKLAEVPLFQSYVFVRINTANQYPEIRKINGVLNFVYWLGKPAVIQEQEIISIRKFLSDYQQVQLIKAQVSPGVQVQFLREPATEKACKPEDQQEVFKLLLPSLGYMLSAQAEKAKVEVIKTAASQKKVPQITFNNYRLSLD